MKALQISRKIRLKQSAGLLHLFTQRDSQSFSEPCVPQSEAQRSERMLVLLAAARRGEELARSVREHGFGRLEEDRVAY